MTNVQEIINALRVINNRLTNLEAGMMAQKKAIENLMLRVDALEAEEQEIPVVGESEESEEQESIG